MIATNIVKLYSVYILASKYIGNLLKGVEVDGSNYYIWRQKIQYMLYTGDTLLAITKIRGLSTDSASIEEG